MAGNRNRAAAVALTLAGAAAATWFFPDSGTVHALGFALVIAAAWRTGTPGGTWLTAALSLTLLAGGLAAVSGRPGAGFFGLLLGVAAIPLVVTTVGFAIRFQPPDLTRLKDPGQ